MFHMLTCFNLQPGAALEEFQHALDDFAQLMKAEDLVSSIGPIGRRHRHEIMDTDEERNHEYFFITSFRDRAHCDLAVEHIMPHTEPADASHRSVYAKIRDPVFICFEDV